MFLDIKFPNHISYNSVGGVEFVTDVAMLSSGFEVRKSINSIGRGRYNIASAIKSRVDAEEIMTFFRLVGGRYCSFRFKDWNDFVAKDQKLQPASDDFRTFRFVKKYQICDFECTRLIAKPIGRSVVFAGHVGEYEIDSSIGFVTFAQAQNPEMLSVSLEFDTEVRFDTDVLEVGFNDEFSSVIKSIPLVEVL